MKKDYRLAIEDCRTALRIDPQFAKGYQRAGKCFLSLGDFSEAKRQLKEAEKLEPHNKTLQQELESVRQAEYFLSAAQTAFAEKEPRRAVTNAEQGLKLAPASQELQILLVKAHLAQKNYGEATRIARSAFVFS